jgi:hypothetical protein
MKMKNQLEIERREAIADAEFETYKFGEGVKVAGFDGWDTNDLDDFTKIVYIVCDDHGPEDDSIKVSFHVRFDESGNVDDVYGLVFSSGNDIGTRGETQVHPLSTDVETKIKHSETGDQLHAAMNSKWSLIDTKFSHGNSRLTGGWWLYQGDHSKALELLEVQKKTILNSVVW